MKAVVIKSESEIKLGVVDVPTELVERLLDDYYTEENGAFVRSYRSDTPHIEKTAAAFEKFGVAYLSQSLGLEPVPWEDGLIAFLEKVQHSPAEWLLIGSCALAVRGIPVQPRGVDLVMKINDLDKVREWFANCTVVPFERCADWVCLGYGAAFLGAPVSIGFEPQTELDNAGPIDSGPYAMAHAQVVEWRGFQVKVPPIELSLNINRARNRADRVSLIESYMAGR